jgi:hypothetical protein
VCSSDLNDETQGIGKKTAKKRSASLSPKAKTLKPIRNEEKSNPRWRGGVDEA